MQISLDVVDLWQLREIWSKRPIVTAFTRLQERPPALPSVIDFDLDDLMPRLARLKNSAIWRAKEANRDPARLPMGEISEAYMVELYPEAPSFGEQRQQLFTAAYARYVIAHYRSSTAPLQELLSTLVEVRNPESVCLDTDRLPLPGAAVWIPADITDEIRGLDTRYDPAEPGAPAAYVVAEDFWLLLAKATDDELDDTVKMYCRNSESASADLLRRELSTLYEVAHSWNRSPSVVGLCYLISA